MTTGFGNETLFTPRPFTAAEWGDRMARLAWAAARRGLQPRYYAEPHVLAKPSLYGACVHIAFLTFFLSLPSSLVAFFRMLPALSSLQWDSLSSEAIYMQGPD